MARSASGRRGGARSRDAAPDGVVPSGELWLGHGGRMGDCEVLTASRVNGSCLTTRSVRADAAMRWAPDHGDNTLAETGLA